MITMSTLMNFEKWYFKGGDDPVMETFIKNKLRRGYAYIVLGFVDSGHYSTNTVLVNDEGAVVELPFFEDYFSKPIPR